MSAPTFRRKILEAVKDRIASLHNSATGTSGKWFREVRYGALKPSANVRPTATVTDGGQTKQQDQEAPEDCQLRLVAIVTLQVSDEWTKVAANENWSDRVEQLRADFDLWVPDGLGVIRIDYVTDDPVDVVLGGGSSEAGWQITFAILRTDNR